MAVALLVVLSTLAGCTTSPNGSTVRGSQSGGSDIDPKTVTRNFFNDLRSALKDSQLANDDKRGEWVEQLASYFAPNERDDQRIALRSALDNFVAGREKLAPNEDMTIDVRYDDIEIVSEASNRASVRLVNGRIDILITRTTDTSVITLYKDNVSIDKIIGGANAALPVIRIGRTWYLSEG